MEKYTKDQLILLKEAIEYMLSEGDLIFTQYSDLDEVRKDVVLELRNKEGR